MASPNPVWARRRLLLLLLAGASGCSEDQVLTTTRNLERPGPLAMVCATKLPDGKGYTGLPNEACAPVEGAEPSGTLYGLVANTSRGDVALFGTREGVEPLFDLDPGSPGFGFLPVGSLPTDMDASSDGCRAVLANSGSCDLSVIDVPGLVETAEAGLGRPASSIVARVTPRTAAGPLRARPQELVIVPGAVPKKDDTEACSTTAAYRAYVSFPSCNLVAEIDLSTGMILQALIFTPSGAVPTSEPSCPTECVDRALPDLGPSADVAAGDATVADTGAADGAADGGADGAVADAALDAAPVDAASAADSTVVEAGPTDAGVGDARDSGQGSDLGASAGSVGVLPYSLALTQAGDRLYVSSAGANFVTVADVDAASGAIGNTRQIVLEGERAQTTRVVLSPASTSDEIGRFVYAIARDRTVRVISTARERECETNVDLEKVADGGLQTSATACFPVGDPTTPPRRVAADGPGLRLTSDRLPLDVAFITSEADAVDGGVGGPPAVPLRGTFALIAGSDGTVYVVDIEDSNFIPGAVGTVPAAHLPHRFRNINQGTAAGAADAGVASITGTGNGGIPVIVTEENGAALPGAGITLRAPGETVTGEWNMVYEGVALTRTSGQIKLAAAADALHLVDHGADFCGAGIQARLRVEGRPARQGDIVVLGGCKNDGDCGLGRVCRKPVARQVELGLCLDRGREDVLFRQCAAFLQQPREFLVTGVERDRLTLDALPREPQRVMLQPQQAGDCASNGDCASGYLCALEDRLVNGDSEGKFSVKAGRCFRPGCESDDDCPGGSCIAPLDGSPRTCAPVRWPLEVSSRSCNSDADCEPPSEGSACEVDGDCGDNRAECAVTIAPERRCRSRQLRCSRFAGLSRRCVRASPCFDELLGYEVRAGRAFLLAGGHRQVADPATGQCRIDESESPLLANRVPVGLPVYPALVGEQCQAPVSSLTPRPNPCVDPGVTSYAGYREKEGGGGTLVHEAQAVGIVRFSNAEIAFGLGVSHLTEPPPVTPTTVDAGVAAQVPPMPQRGMSIRLLVSSGFARQVVVGASGALSLPGRMVVGPDRRVYISDMGDRTGTTGTRGQVFRFDTDDLSINNFLVK